MSDDRDIVRGYSEDRRVYHHKSHPIENKTSTKINLSQRNSSEMLSLFSSSIKRLDRLELATYRSIVNDQADFHMINYPIQSRPPTPVPNIQQQLTLPNQNLAKKVDSKCFIFQKDSLGFFSLVHYKDKRIFECIIKTNTDKKFYIQEEREMKFLDIHK